MTGKQNRQLSHRSGGQDGIVPAAIYARVSSEAQDVENSVDAQITQCREWAGRYGYFVVKVFTDRARSGRADNRPDFQEMVNIAGRPDCPFEVVLVWKFSRFFRDRIESSYYKNRLRRSGFRVVSINEPVDDSPVGKLTEGVLEAIDGFQSDSISQDVRRGTRNLAGRGFFLAGQAPYGMTRVQVQDGGKIRHRLAPDSRTAPNIRRLFDLALMEMTEGQIRQRLNQEGVPNASGGRWESHRIHDVLTNPHYAGTIVWGKSSKMDDPVTVHEAHEGIVSRQEFEQVQALLQARAPEVANPRHSGSGRLLSGLVKRGWCGSSFNYTPAGRDGRTYSYMVCASRKHHGGKQCGSPWLPTEKFEPLVMKSILEDIITKDNIAKTIGELRAETADSRSKSLSKLENIDSSLKRVMERQRKLYLVYENGDIDYELYSARNRELREMRGSVEAQRERVQSAAGERMIILDNQDAVLAHAEELNTFLRTREPSRCRSWLMTFVRCVWIESGKASIEYSIPLPEEDQFSGSIRRFFDFEEDVPPSARSGPLSRG